MLFSVLSFWYHLTINPKTWRYVPNLFWVGLYYLHILSSHMICKEPAPTWSSLYKHNYSPFLRNWNIIWSAPNTVLQACTETVLNHCLYLKQKVTPKTSRVKEKGFALPKGKTRTVCNTEEWVNGLDGQSISNFLTQLDILSSQLRDHPLLMSLGWESMIM